MPDTDTGRSNQPGPLDQPSVTRAEPLAVKPFMRIVMPFALPLVSVEPG